MTNRYVLTVAAVLVGAIAVVWPADRVLGIDSPPATQPTSAVSGLLATANGYFKADPVDTTNLAAMGISANSQLAANLAAGDMDWTSWKLLAAKLAPYLSVADQGTWTDQLKNAASTAALPSLKLIDLEGIVGNLRAFKDPQASTLTAQWMGASNAWQALSSSDLGALAHDLSLDGDSGRSARQQLAGFVEGKFLVSTDTAKQMALEGWGQLALGLAADLSTDSKNLWISRIRGAYADAAAIPNLTTSQIQGLAGSLGALGDPNASTMLADWVITSTNWQNAEVLQLSRIVGALDAQLPSGPASRKKILDYVEGSVLTDPAKISANGPVAWLGMYQAFAKELTKEQRANWASKVQGVYGNAASFAAMDFRQADRTATLLSQLAPYSANTLFAGYINKTDSWKGAKAQDLGKALYFLKGTAPLYVDARARIRGYLIGSYLNDVGRIRAVPMSSWDLLRVLFDDAPVAEQEIWRTQMAQAFATSDEQIAALPLSVAVTLYESMRFSDPQQAAHGAWVWLTHAPDKGKYLERDLARLVRLAIAANDKSRDEKTAFLANLEQVWSGQSGTIQGDYTRSLSIARIYRGAGYLAKAREWITKAYQTACATDEARQLLGVQEIGNLADNILQTTAGIPSPPVLPGLTVPAGGGTANQSSTGATTQPVAVTEFPEMAATLAYFARQGTLRSHWFIEFGRLVSAPQSRAILAAELQDPQGNVRVDVAHILSWSYLVAGDLRSWQTQIDQKIADPNLTGDAKALWLVAKAFTDQLADPRLDLRYRRKSLDQALAAAQSEPVRFAVLRELVDLMAALNWRPRALTLIDSLAGQFGPDIAAQIATMRGQIAAENDELSRQAAQTDAARAKQWLIGRLNLCKNRLARAKADGNTASQQELEKQIQNLENQLKQAN